MNKVSIKDFDLATPSLKRVNITGLIHREDS